MLLTKKTAPLGVQQLAHPHEGGDYRSDVHTGESSSETLGVGTRGRAHLGWGGRDQSWAAQPPDNSRCTSRHYGGAWCT